jgi:hypothetical protein
MRNFNEAEKQKLIQIINQGSQVLGEVDDLKSGLEGHSERHLQKNLN